jgi:glycine hydroxymethyltransferase
LTEKEMEQVAEWIDRALKNSDNPDVLSEIRAEVKQLCQSFPLYPQRLG